MTKEQIRQQVFQHLGEATRILDARAGTSVVHARAHAASVHVDIARVYAGLLS